MRKNLLLDIATVACGFLCLLQIAFFLFFTGFLIHWHIDPEYYAKIPFKPFSETSGIGLGYSVTSFWKVKSNETPLVLSNIWPLSIYFAYIHLSTITFLMFSIFKEFTKIIRSVRLIQTFKTTNVKSFKKIGHNFFVLFILTSFAVLIFQRGMFYAFAFRLTPLIFSMVAYILAEIFSEGNKLAEESNLTI